MQQPEQKGIASNPLRVLRLDASARSHDSVSRSLAAEVVDRLWQTQFDLDITRRDLAITAPGLMSEDWVGATFTTESDRTPEQRATLAESDELVAELQAADVILIATPIYNFGVPAALKAWIDKIARVGLTFHYTENGPQGLLQNKRAIIVVASGGTAVGGEIDFATPYLRHVLGFVGITEVEVIAADQLARRGEEAAASARDGIARLQVSAIPKRAAA